MKVIIFAGGSGRRLWPISLKNSPKQFEPILGDQSTLQLAVARVQEVVGLENILISTNQSYLPLITAQLPQLPAANLIGEPVRRDLAAAVGLATIHLSRLAAPDEPAAILWGDNYMEDVAAFQALLGTAATLVREHKARIVFMGETPRFANHNLGWIGLGERLGEAQTLAYHRFESLRYRPELEECQRMYASGRYVWNTGYFVTTPAFLQAEYAGHQPALWADLSRLAESIGTPAYEAMLQAIYPQLPEASFDDAILRHIAPESAVVLHAPMGWSDPGTLYALKEALNPDPQANVTHGLVMDDASRDCLLYNYEPDKLLAAIGLEGMIVVNTGQTILVVHKDHIPLVKKLVDRLADSQWRHYT